VRLVPPAGGRVSPLRVAASGAGHRAEDGGRDGVLLAACAPGPGSRPLRPAAVVFVCSKAAVTKSHKLGALELQK